MSRTLLPPPEMGRPGRRPRCPGPAGRPLPDPAAVRLCAVPDTAPPYDDEALPGPAPREPAPASGSAGAAGDRPGRSPVGGEAAGRPAAVRGTECPALAGQFAQVLVETLAGARPPRQMSTWTTERARNRIQRLGPVLAASQGPRLRRVVAFQPRPDVIEMTLVVTCGPRIRALAVRLEHLTPRHAGPGQPSRPGRWLCTEVEAA